MEGELTEAFGGDGDDGLEAGLGAEVNAVQRELDEDR